MVLQIQVLWLKKAHISLQGTQGFSHHFQWADCKGYNCPDLLQYAFSTGALALKKKKKKSNLESDPDMLSQDFQARS